MECLVDPRTAAGIIGVVLVIGATLAWFLSNGDEDDG